VVVALGTVSCPYEDGDTCTYRGPQIDKHVLVDLTDVELPILGNTQLTKNSQNNADQIDDATKLNEYVSWYLNGANDKAEYAPTDATTTEGISKIVDFSGPLKKLLPSIIQDAQRVKTITYDQETYTSENDDGTAGAEVTEPANHDQIVVCADKSGPLGLFGKVTPHECYSGGGKEAPLGPEQKYRLSTWEKGDLGISRNLSAAVTELLLKIPGITSNIIGESISVPWDQRTPPLPWGKGQDGKPFASPLYYQKAYNEWRGKTCVIAPLINKLFCLDLDPTNVFVTSEYADLFPYVPLANTVDKKGSQLITSTIIRAPRAEILTTSYEIKDIPQLYISHSLEDADLSDLLKKTFKPKTDAGAAETTTTPKDVEDNNATCRVINSRSNPGDDATFDLPKSAIEVDVHYTVGEIQCQEPHQVCKIDKDPESETYRQEVCKPQAACQSEVYATIPSVSKTPYANEIWANTTAGSDSVFRRIYPKTGPNSPVSCIADLPAVSNATYTINDESTGGVQIDRVIEPDGSGAGGERGTDSVNAKLYYPHFGGVLEYFLKGIQTALRPKGYGEQPVSGQYCGNVTCGELPKDLPKASGSCNLGSVSSNVGNIPQALKDIVSAAAETYKVPPSLILGVMYGEGAFNRESGGGRYSRYNWTEQNVKNWASCQKMPNCSGPDSSVVPFAGTWDTLAKRILPDLQKIDPAKKQADACNLLDATFALAKDLHDNAGGSSSMTGKSCFGIKMTSTNPASCSWDNSQYETSIRVWEIGTAYDSVKTCLTTDATDLGKAFGSCGTGVPSSEEYVNYLCKGGDNCETFDNHSTDPSVNSHNACVWDVSTAGGTGNRK
jgi:hypothetical protein